MRTSPLSELSANFRPRFGLFTQPPYITNGANYEDVPYNRIPGLTIDRVGKVIAPEGKLKGVLNNKMKAGKNDDVLFSAPGYNGIGDTYVGTAFLILDPDKLMRFSYVNGANSAPREYKAWRTNDNKKTV